MGIVPPCSFRASPGFALRKCWNSLPGPLVCDHWHTLVPGFLRGLLQFFRKRLGMNATIGRWIQRKRRCSLHFSWCPTCDSKAMKCRHSHRILHLTFKRFECYLPSTGPRKRQMSNMKTYLLIIVIFCASPRIAGATRHRENRSAHGPEGKIQREKGRGVRKSRSRAMT